MGGRGAGRSTVASQYALAKLIDPTYYRCAIMRFILGDIRNSIFREITDRAEEQGIKEALDITDNAMVIKYGNNTIQAHGFRKSSGDQKAKLKSLANYNCVIIEEAEEIPEEDFLQLDDTLRTVKGDIKVILLLNPPPKSHWIIRRWFDLDNTEAPGFYKPRLKADATDVVAINTDYTVNRKNIDDATVGRYEKYKETNPSHYWNMIKGYVPEVVQGRIYSNWQEIDEVPHEARLECYGLDFGLNPDPAAICAVYYYNGGYILDELLYQTDLMNRQLANVIQNQPYKAITIADSAEPKSIAELKEMGIDIIPCEKGSDSVRAGIKKVQSLKISYTKRSLNLKREYENYRNKVNKDGEEVASEDPACDNHLMSAVRYGLSMQLPNDPLKELEQKLDIYNFQRERVETAKQDVGL
jgi:phage terminase large subunit